MEICDRGEDSLENIATLLKDYQQRVLTVYVEREQLRKLFCDAKRELDSSLEQQNHSHQRIITLQGSLKSLQDSTLHKLSVLDENEILKKEVVVLKEKHAKAEEENSKKIEKLENNVQDLLKDATLEKEEIKRSYEAKINEVEKKYQKALEEKSELLKLSEQNVLKLKSDFKTEFEKYASETEIKLAKLQPNNSLSENQDIFRKKLLHEKKENDKEKYLLKKRICELEQLVSTSQAKKSCPPLKLRR